MANTKNKYAFDREYYEKLARFGSIDGNAARKLEVYSDEELYSEDVYDGSDYEEEEYYENTDLTNDQAENVEISTDKITVRGTENDRIARTRYVVRPHFFRALVITMSVGILICSSVYMLKLQSELSQTQKKIYASEKVLSNAVSLNDSLRTQLDTGVDRNYIYNVAVGRLGMVYPDSNCVSTYEVAATDHVRQYGQFR